jgi:membrane-bound lytic murein transglycosylase MltF
MGMGRKRRTLAPLAILQALLAAGFLLAISPACLSASAESREPAPVEGSEDELIPLPNPWKGDLDRMVKERRLRFVVPHSRTFYFIDGATQRGTAVELGYAFQKWLNKKYAKNQALGIRILFIPVSRDRLIPSVVDGIGDIAVGNLTITEDRLKVVDFSNPFLTNVKEVVVTGPESPPLRSVDDLAGRKIYVRKSSSYYEHLERLNREFKKNGKKKITLKRAEEDLEDEDILEMVNAGILPFAVVDDHKANFWAQVLENLSVRQDLVINEGGRIAWAVRKNSPKLISEINAFLKKHKKGTEFGNIIFKRYLKSTQYVTNATAAEEMKKYNRVVDIFKKYSDRYDFDYLMLLAQGYQESKLDQSLRSHRGAVGVMQVLPSTARSDPINITGVEKDVEKNIHAGVKYLRHLAETYLDDPDIDDRNRTLMAFAAYNAGPGNLDKMRRMAEKSGLDPNVWFDNVELAAAKIIGQETVRYVSNIYKYYVAYKMVEERTKERENAIEKIRRKS